VEFLTTVPTLQVPWGFGIPASVLLDTTIFWYIDGVSTLVGSLNKHVDHIC
jgi:hypothetical protein